MIVVGSVVGLRDHLRWFDRRPLFGRRVVVTRSRAQASQQTALLRSRGAEAIELPTIAIEPVPIDLPDSLPVNSLSGERVDESEWTGCDPLTQALLAIAAVKQKAWVIFTSVNGVEALEARMRALGLDARIFAGTRLAVIGEPTAEALRRLGLEPDLIPEAFVGEALADALLERLGESVTESSFYLLRADLARPHLREALQGAGGEVHEVTAYHTRPVKEVSEDALAELEAGVDAITFASSSTVTNFLSLLGDRLPEWLAREDRMKLVSIGPVTSETLRAAGLPVDAEAEVHSIPGLIAALEQLFSTDSTSPLG
jgi:uroporphyrinogen III methyltransferase/synthase